MKLIPLCYEVNTGKEKIISQNSWFLLTSYPFPSFSKIFHNSVLSDQRINYVCPKLILESLKTRRTIIDLRQYWQYIRQWNRNTIHHNGQRQSTCCQFYCHTYG